MSNSQILCLFQLYNKAQYQGVHDFNIGFWVGIPPYLLRDKGYPCISWIMTPFKVGNHIILRFFIIWNISAVGPLCKTILKLWKKHFNKCITQLNYVLCLMCWCVVFYYTTSSTVKGPSRLSNSYHRKCKTIKTYRTCIWGNPKQCRRWFSNKC